MSVEELQKVFQAAYQEAVRFGVRDPLSLAHAYATMMLAWLGYPSRDRPDVISGYRSPEKQAAMLAAWNAGQRQGMKYKPAKDSWHTKGLAIDVQTGVKGYSAYEAIMRALGVRVGADFGDRGHFDWPIKDEGVSI